MSLDIANYLTRIAEFQTTVISGSNAVPVAVYTQGDYPYWLNRLDGIQTERDGGMGAYNVRYDITIGMLLLRGKALEGEDTQLEQQCQTDVYSVLSKFLSNPNLITSTYTTPQAGYYPKSLQIEAVRIGLVETHMGSEYLLRFSHIEQEFETL